MYILIINGPNLNMLKRRDKEIYGDLDLKKINKELTTKFKSLKFKFYQTNHEGKIIDKIQKINHKCLGIIINPGAFTHYSYAIRDALEIIKIPKVEVHLSNILKRDDFRKISVIQDVVDQTFMGEYIHSYFNAVNFIIQKGKTKDGN